MKTIKVQGQNIDEILSQIKRTESDNLAEFETIVKNIVADVKENKDKALFAYTEKFDHVKLDVKTVKVTKEEIDQAYARVPERTLDVIRKSMESIRQFHELQKQKSWFTTDEKGSLLGQKYSPMESAGVYVPGGKAAYPSSVLMNILPAKIAGVKNIIMCTPSHGTGEIEPVVLVAANEAGVGAVYKVGGAQAIAAMAYGTPSIPKVDKIVGPGNIFVALAKKYVFGDVSIDSVAGPSEILVLADETTNPRFAAADLMSQAEHDEMASAILVTTSEKTAELVEAEIEKMLPTLSRAEIIQKSLDDNGKIFICADREEAVQTANGVAPEHLEILMQEPLEILAKLNNAGAIFIGSYSSEPLGDYFAGPNHVLPTSGTARFFSPLTVDDFVKKSSVIYYSESALRGIHEDIEYFAKCEQLTAHANSIAVRFEEE